MKKQRIAAIIACFILMAVTSLSLFYIEKELNHDCTGEDCAVCMHTPGRGCIKKYR